MKKSILRVVAMILVMLLTLTMVVACDLRGEQGPQGEPGPQGEQGEQGVDGKDGAGISKAEYDDQGRLVITLTDGTVLAPVELPRPDGTEGLEYYLFPDGTYGVTAGTALYLAEIEIPATYNGKAVTQILPQAFENAKNLTSISIPDSITSIGEDAFLGCRNIERVYITDIASWCEINICGSSAIPLQWWGGLYLNGELITNLVIPDGVTKIGDYAFFGCYNITSVEIPSSVTSIGEHAFYGCSNLRSIEIPDSVRSIGDYALSGCFVSITIPNSVTSMGYDVFYGCYKLVEVINKSSLPITTSEFGEYGDILEIHNGATKIVNQNGYLFYTYEGVNYLLGYVGTDTALTLPAKYNGQSYEIYQNAFDGCTSITSITIPDGVTSIGEHVFYGCSSLEEITIPNSVTSIGGYAFGRCEKLTSVTIGNGVTSIGNSAFYGCAALTSITVGSNNQAYRSINGNLYSKDGKMLIQYAIGKNDARFAIPEGVTSIGYEAFSNCTYLTSITIPNSVTSIGEYAFGACSSLTSVTIPNGVTSIGHAMFYNCTSLESIDIPASVTSIESYALADCSSLTSIRYRGTESQWWDVYKGYNWDDATGDYTITYNYTGN